MPSSTCPRHALIKEHTHNEHMDMSLMLICICMCRPYSCSAFSRRLGLALGLFGMQYSPPRGDKCCAFTSQSLRRLRLPPQLIHSRESIAHALIRDTLSRCPRIWTWQQQRTLGRAAHLDVAARSAVAVAPGLEMAHIDGWHMPDRHICCTRALVCL